MESRLHLAGHIQTTWRSPEFGATILPSSLQTEIIVLVRQANGVVDNVFDVVEFSKLCSFIDSEGLIAVKN